MRILTGIQPSGVITLGNYLGSIKNFKSQLNEGDESFIFLADLHALTTLPDRKVLEENTRTLLALYIAMDMHKVSSIFIQSLIGEHAELAWVLQCLTRNGELDRMTQYKEKSQKNITVSTGLYTYPTLMAADILLYKTDQVPVGQDQKQHLELTRDLAERFNTTYKKEIFTLPNPLIKKEGAKIYSLIDPTKKMSKSDENEKSYISMLDSPKKIEKKIKSATTDSVGEINYDPQNQPGVSNLLTIYSICENTSMEDTLRYFEKKNYGFLKEQVAKAIIKELEPIQSRYEKIISDKEILDEVLIEGTKKAKKIASQTLKEVKEAMGLYTYKK